MSSISNNSLSSYLQTLLNNQLQTSGIANQQTNSSSVNVSPLEPQQSDGGQLSQFAQVVNALENLQESNPAQYQQVTAQIAANLQQAAHTALSGGNFP